MKKKEDKNKIDEKIWKEYSNGIKRYNFNISKKFNNKIKLKDKENFNNFFEYNKKSENFLINKKVENEFDLIRNFLENNNNEENTNKKIKRSEIRKMNSFKTIDLHGMTKSEASEAIIFLINESWNEDILSIKIITGKGDVLQKHAISILKNSSLITKFSFARENDGGTGAFYAIIKNKRNIK